MAKVFSSGWNVSLGLLVAGIIAVGVLTVSEVRAGGDPAPCMALEEEEPQEDCYCSGTGGGAQCNSLPETGPICASNSHNGVLMPIWDEIEEEWTEESCAGEH